MDQVRVKNFVEERFSTGLGKETIIGRGEDDVTAAKQVGEELASGQGIGGTTRRSRKPFAV